jgi:hypothetical protein
MIAVEQPVWEWLEDARQKLDFAEAELKDLDRLTFALDGPVGTEARARDVIRTYVSWLVFVRQACASINEAGREAGRPSQFSHWWAGLNTDPTHAYFRAERNAALKGREEVVLVRRIEDVRMTPVGYWAFARGPHALEPLVPRCQLYCDWLYESALVPARVHLFDWTLRERITAPVTGFG